LTKSIRCVIEKYYHNEDTAFGNRMYHWLQSFCISYKTNFEYKVLVQSGYWPELVYITLPNTFARKHDIFLYDNNEIIPNLNREDISNILFDGDLQKIKSQNHWSVSDWVVHDGFYQSSVNEFLPDNVFKLIEFRSNEINSYIKEIFNDFISIHLRRYHGVQLKDGDIEDIPEHLREKYLNKKSKYTDPEYNNFIRDSEYFEIIDKILKNNPNQKFYISSDISPEYYQHYKERYKNIFDKSDYEKEFIRILEKDHPPKLVKKTKIIALNMLDFFALANSKLIIMSDKSTWGKFAQKIKQNKFIHTPLYPGQIENIKYTINN